MYIFTPKYTNASKKKENEHKKINLELQNWNQQRNKKSQRIEATQRAFTWSFIKLCWETFQSAIR